MGCGEWVVNLGGSGLIGGVGGFGGGGYGVDGGVVVF